MSCEEIINIDIPDSEKKKLVFKGIISSAPPPYFFQLTKSASIEDKDDTYEGVEDATVIIEDITAGIKDTLQVLKPNTEDIQSIYYDLYNYYTHQKEQYYISSVDCNRCHGVYATTKIFGLENHTYKLMIQYKGQHYTAEETMAPATKLTDMKMKPVNLGEKGKTFAPCISFKNQPNVDNYYLFSLSIYSTYEVPIADIYHLFTSPTDWYYSILSDEHLEHEVIDLTVSDGESTHKIVPGGGYPPVGDSLFVRVESLSKACYDIYDRVIGQIRTDGGAYTPAPTNVESNISGGMLGFFRVSSYSEIGMYIDRH